MAQALLTFMDSHDPGPIQDGPVSEPVKVDEKLLRELPIFDRARVVQAAIKAQGAAVHREVVAAYPQD